MCGTFLAQFVVIVKKTYLKQGAMYILKEIIYSIVVIIAALALVLAISLNSLIQRYTKSSYLSGISQVNQDSQTLKNQNLKILSHQSLEK